MPEHPRLYEDLAAGLRELTTLLLCTTDTAQALRRTADTTAQMLPQRPLVAVTLDRAGQAITEVSSQTPGTLSARLKDSHEYGPGRACLHSRTPVTVTDVASESRWDLEWLRAEGVRSVYWHPLRATHEAVGALGLYSREPVVSDPQIRLAIQMTAEHIGALLGATIHGAAQAAMIAQLDQALVSHAVVDQAVGVVMAQRGCDPDTALAILRRASQNSNRKLTDLAASILASAHRVRPEPGGGRR
ncbi:GAF and ANTAR domain-containing protein [Kutzneria kofuensis]|uniref:ANTAR domain-containing protein n=1 Tax=Kutzneria kofuensis TaxID=103725 RepID=A0A7W9NEQ6_9PSEU|nr:GAF and ANTAR domain-containing protein [Kutzneria kofuensis]MBB5889925.1 hypothetical protein [Kutzneria kofuensis]